MPTVTSWTDALRDTHSLIRFRMATIRKRRRLRLSIVTLGLLTLAAASVPAFLPGAADYDSSHAYAFDVFLILPSVYAGFLVLAAISAVASGGGRELVPREQGVAFPITPAVDHLGALLMAPLNIAWLLQGWLLLGATAYVVGPGAVVLAEIVALLWLFLATAVAQVVAWTMEAIRRGPHGIAIARTIIGAIAGGAGLLVATGHLNAVLDGLPTVYLITSLATLTDGFSIVWPVTVLLLTAATAGAVLLGVLPARAALGRAARDEARIETGTYPARHTAARSRRTSAPRSDAGLRRAG